MNWRSFLYRRLCSVATCELGLPTGGRLALQSKYEVASASDTLVHPFYWQLFQWYDAPPTSIVDCGGNCGHFSVIADICSRVRFGRPAQHYTVIEPNPFLITTIRRTLASSGLTSQTRIIEGLLGCPGEHADLWVHPKNYLVSGMSQFPGARAHRVACVRASSVVPPGPVSVLKIDIEGGEFGLLRDEPDLFRRTRLLLFELHPDAEGRTGWFLKTLDDMGFQPAGPQVEHSGLKLIALRKI